jgi:hypothetical protein
LFPARKNRHILINPLVREKVDSWSDVARSDVGESALVEMTKLCAEWRMTLADFGPDIHPVFTVSPTTSPQESDESVQIRVERFWKWLNMQRQSCVVVVSHRKILGGKGASGFARGLGILHFLGLYSLENGEAVVLNFSENGWNSGGVSNYAAEGETVGVCYSLQEAKQLAQSKGCFIINEAVDRSKFIVRSINTPRATRLREFSGGPWRVHVAPLHVCVGLGCSVLSIQNQRVRTCVEVMMTNKVCNLVWTCSQSEFISHNFFKTLGEQTDLMNSPDFDHSTWRVIVDTRSKSTQGNARFSLQRILEEFADLGCMIVLHLVTSDFHMERARLIFERACSAIFVRKGHNFDVRCYPSVHTGEALIDSSRYTLQDRHLMLERAQQVLNGKVDDNRIINSWI